MRESIIPYDPLRYPAIRFPEIGPIDSLAWDLIDCTTADPQELDWWHYPGCWEWVANPDVLRRGSACIKGWKPCVANFLVWALRDDLTAREAEALNPYFRSYFTPAMYLDRTCASGTCVNPFHVEIRAIEGLLLYCHLRKDAAGCLVFDGPEGEPEPAGEPFRYGTRPGSLRREYLHYWGAARGDGGDPGPGYQVLAGCGNRFCLAPEHVTISPNRGRRGQTGPRLYTPSFLRSLAEAATSLLCAWPECDAPKRAPERVHSEFNVCRRHAHRLSNAFVKSRRAYERRRKELQLDEQETL